MGNGNLLYFLKPGVCLCQQFMPQIVMHSNNQSVTQHILELGAKLAMLSELAQFHYIFTDRFRSSLGAIVKVVPVHPGL